MLKEWKERVDAFTCYHWIVFHVEPTIERLYLGNLTIPSYIKEQVEKLKEKPDDVFYYRGFFLSSASIHQILINLIEKDIPLFKVGNKEISCITDIKRLWDETKLSDFFLIPKPRSERYSQIKAYLLPQILEIKKHFQAIKPKKQDTPASTPKRKLRGIKKPYTDKNEYNTFLKRINKSYKNSSLKEKVRVAVSEMEGRKIFLDDNGKPLYTKGTIRKELSLLSKFQK